MKMATAEWWTINQAMIWLTTRSEDLVARAAPRPRGSSKPLTWLDLEYIRCSPGPLSDAELDLADEIDGPLSAVLLSCLSTGRIKAKQLDTLRESVIPKEWFLGASIGLSGKPAVHVVLGPVEGEPREMNVLVLSEDVRREFPFGHEPGQATEVAQGEADRPAKPRGRGPGTQRALAEKAITEMYGAAPRPEPAWCDGPDGPQGSEQAGEGARPNRYDATIRRAAQGLRDPPEEV